MSSFTLPSPLPVTECFIETGTHRGDSLRIALDMGYQKCKSVELSPPLYESARQRFAGEPRVELFLGSSPVLLPTMIEPDLTTTFWLDAHYTGNSGSVLDQVYGECPLVAELRVILMSPWKLLPLVLIDDAFIFDEDTWQTPGPLFEPAHFRREHWPRMAELHELLDVNFKLSRYECVLVCVPRKGELILHHDQEACELDHSGS